VVFAVAAVGLAGAQPAVSDGPVADLVGTLAGPTSGAVGDVLTYTVTAANRGPDPGDANVEFATESATFDLVASDPSCPVSPSSGQFLVICPVEALAAGTTMQLRVQVRVTHLVEASVDGLVNPLTATDPDTSNNAKSFAFLAPSRPPAPAPPSPPPPSVPFTSGSLPNATQYRSFFTPLIAGSYFPMTIAVVAGTLPPGLAIDAAGMLTGSPFTPGSYTFTIEVADGVPSQTARHEFTMIVNPYDGAKSESTGTPGPPASLVGTTILIAKQTRTSGCKLRALPDRRCSPGAYYSKLTKKVICAPGFRTSKIRYLPDSVKQDVESEYGLTPNYGSTLEIDQIVSLELGGSNDLANLYPERVSPAAGYRSKDKLENKLHHLVCAGSMTLRAAQIGIATNWRTLYKTVYDSAP
jgi:hypothetical protein